MNEDFLKMISETITPRQWLQYYLNVFQRNVIAAAVDVQTTKTEIASFGTDAIVKDDDTNIATPPSITAADLLVKRQTRLVWKIATLDSIKALMALSDEDLAATWSADTVAAILKSQEEPEEEAAADVALTTYNVVDKSVVYAGNGADAANGPDTIQLDPAHADTVAWLASGAITVVAAPAASTDAAASPEAAV